MNPGNTVIEDSRLVDANSQLAISHMHVIDWVYEFRFLLRQFAWFSYH